MTRTREKAIVFVGPTLPAQEAAAILDADIRPPAKRGDIYRALRDGFTQIVLIDGEFHGAPSVWHRELLSALAGGVTIHGAASMGALRAAELHTFGMTGCGAIFEWYRDGTIEGDDEVALHYFERAGKYRSISEPLVNIRATLAEAVPGLISSSERDALVEHTKKQYYPTRSLQAVTASGPADSWPPERRAALAEFLDIHRVDQKRRDAVAVLSLVSAGCLPAQRPLASLNDHMWRHRLLAETWSPDGGAIDTGWVAAGAQLSPSGVDAFRRTLSERFFVVKWAQANGLAPTPADMEKARAGVCTNPQLPLDWLETRLKDRALFFTAVRAMAPLEFYAAPRAALARWAAANGIEHPGLEGPALTAWMVEEGPARFGFFWDFPVELFSEVQLLGRWHKNADHQ